MKRLLTCLLSVFLLQTGIQSPVLAAWTGELADQEITFDNDASARYPRIATDFRDFIHVVFRETVAGIEEILYTRSVDNGMTWSGTSADQIISFPDGSNVYEFPDIATIPSGTILVVWAEPEGATREILLSSSMDGGVTWSGAIIDKPISYLGGTPNSAGNPSITGSPDNSIHVVWHQKGESLSNQEIHYSRSTDGGLNWSGGAGDTIISFPDGNSALYPDIASDSLNNLYVAWVETDEVTGFDAVHFGKSTDGGLTWSSQSADTIISNPDADKAILGFPRIAIDPSNSVHVTWNESINTSSPYTYEIQYSRSDDGGNTWSGTSADQEISFRDGPSAFYPNILVDKCSNLFVVWGEEQGGVSEPHISISTDHGLIWTGALADWIISFPDVGSGFRPDIATTSDQKLHAVWNETNGSVIDNYEIHYSKGDAICIVPTTTPAFSPSAMITATPTATPTSSRSPTSRPSITGSIAPTRSPTSNKTMSVTPTPSTTGTIETVPANSRIAFFLIFSALLFVCSFLAHHRKTATDKSRNYL